MDAPSSNDTPTPAPGDPLSSPVPGSSRSPSSWPGVSPVASEPTLGTPGAWISGPGKATSWRASRTETRRRTFWLVILTIVLVPVVAVIIALALAGREVGVIASISDDTDGQITRASINTVGGRVQWELFAAPGLGEADGTRLVCDVVRPAFSRHGIPDAEFYVVDRAGDVIGSWRTFCGTPEPEVPAA